MSASETSRFVPGLAVEGRLVHPGRHQQRPEDEREHGDDEPVAGRREAPAVLGARASRRRAGRRRGRLLRAAAPVALVCGPRVRAARGRLRVARAARPHWLVAAARRRAAGRPAPPTRGRAAASAARAALAGRSVASEAEVDEGRHALGAHGIREHQGDREHDGLTDDREPAEAVHHRVREPRRQVLRADPDRDREQDAAGDERRGLAPAGEEARSAGPRRSRSCRRGRTPRRGRRC